MRVVIIDDEIDNIETLTWELDQQPFKTEIVETFTSSIKAYEYLSNHSIDAIFLDIQMPKMSGFELLTALDNRDFQVVFITAFDNFAIEAFKHNAIDYLLKPVYNKELTLTLEKVHNAIDSKKFFGEKLQNIFANQNIIKKIPIHVKNSIILLELDDLIYFEGNSNYTNIYYKQDGILKRNISSKTMGTFEQSLDPNLFLRIHRSYIVNRNVFKELLYEDGKAFLKINDNVTLPISRSHKDMIFKLLS